MKKKWKIFMLIAMITSMVQVVPIQAATAKEIYVNYLYQNYEQIRESCFQIEPKFKIMNVDGKGTPELLVMTDGDFYGTNTITVYTIKKSTVKKVGQISNYELYYNKKNKTLIEYSPMISFGDQYVQYFAKSLTNEKMKTKYRCKEAYYSKNNQHKYWVGTSLKKCRKETYTGYYKKYIKSAKKYNMTILNYSNLNIIV